MQEIIREFAIEGDCTEVQPVVSGHINGTWSVRTDAGQRYVLQRINHHVFQDVEGLMRNVEAVTAHLRAQTDDPRAVLSLVPTREGKTWIHAGDAYYRMYLFVEDSISLLLPESPEDLRASGVAFGRFQRQLADFPAGELVETIPRFHDTPMRYQQLRDAMAENRAGRLPDVQEELDFLLARESEAGLMVDMQRRGELPLRVTHNDTKLSNVLLDRHTRQPLCVIDLDTIMPGLVGNDFGDAIRFGASTALEDEQDLDKVHFSLEMYRAFAEGFLGECGDMLTENELATLPWGAKLMTMECAVRFLADYLNGDTYFHIDRPTHNLDRTRTQIRLIREMEEQWPMMALTR